MAGEQGEGHTELQDYPAAHAAYLEWPSGIMNLGELLAGYEPEGPRCLKSSNILDAHGISKQAEKGEGGRRGKKQKASKEKKDRNDSDL